MSKASLAVGLVVSAGIGLSIAAFITRGGVSHAARARTAEFSAADFRAADRPAAPAVARRFADSGDLDRIRDRGELRIAMFGPHEEWFLQRRGRPTSFDRDAAAEFAQSHGLEPVVVRAESLGEVFDLVEKGYADVAAGRLTVTAARSARVAFARPTHVVSEVVVGRVGDPGLPTGPAELAGREVHVAAESAYAETADRLAASTAPGLSVVFTNPGDDPEAVLHAVAGGEVGLTISDSDLLESVQAYEKRLRALFTVREERQVAWAVRLDNPDLRAALDAFVVERALTGDALVRSTGDLDEIRRRGVLRVLTRNNSTSYFLHRGRAFGFDYELVRSLAAELGVRFEMLIPDDAEDLFTWLEDGRGDLIAAGLTVTAQRAERVGFSVPYLFTDEVVVGRRGRSRFTSARELLGEEIHLRLSSSYAATLRALEPTIGALDLVAADEALETEDLLAMVGRGEIPFTVADEHLMRNAQVWKGDVVPVFRLTRVEPGAVDPNGRPRDRAKSIAFAMRPGNAQLRAAVDRFVRGAYRGRDYNIARRRYFENDQKIRDAKESMADAGRASPYDEIIRRYAREFGLDWRLLAAQAYQESRFDPQARSWVGARGLFQVMPATGAEMGFTELDDPDEGVHAGVRYLARMIDAFDVSLPLDERINFALASYNCGRGHVIDARRLARTHGMDPDRWFGEVEEAIKKLQDREIARTTRYGYCRATEVVGYVRAIRERHRRYVQLLPE